MGADAIAEVAARRQATGRRATPENLEVTDCQHVGGGQGENKMMLLTQEQEELLNKLYAIVDEKVAAFIAAEQRPFLNDDNDRELLLASVKVALNHYFISNECGVGFDIDARIADAYDWVFKFNSRLLAEAAKVSSMTHGPEEELQFQRKYGEVR
jgi:hypothetical protein